MIKIQTQKQQQKTKKQKTQKIRTKRKHNNQIGNKNKTQKLISLIDSSTNWSGKIQNSASNLVFIGGGVWGSPAQK